jgi:acyl-CoA reductase-like NAD-dependent aldehyde dehydrogenase
MAEATNSVHLAKIRARLHFATITLARQAAIKATKRQLQAQGLKVSHFSRRDLVVRAEQYLAEHREELIAEAKEIVERWRVEGYPPQLFVCRYHAQNGASK